MLKITAILMAGLLVIVVGSTSFAADTQPAEANAMTKLGNGLGNALTGWMEIPRNIKEVSQEQDNFAGITVGTLKGSVYGIGRTAAGVLDAATFVVPAYDKPIMEPNYQL